MEGGPPIFRQDCTCPALLEGPSPPVPYGAVTRSGPPFQTVLVDKRETTGLIRFRSPLLAESRLMSFPPATEMFQFAGFASPAYGFSEGSPKGWGCPIRRSRDQRSLASPPGLSQRATSFIASQCQGIHQMPLRRSMPQNPPRTAANAAPQHVSREDTLTSRRIQGAVSLSAGSSQLSALSFKLSAASHPGLRLGHTLSSPCQRTRRQCKAHCRQLVSPRSQPPPAPGRSRRFRGRACRGSP